MHEISLLENLREIIEDEARKQHFSIVTQITLEIGKLSGVEPDALIFGFDAVMKETLAENAELRIENPDGIGFCKQCAKSFVLQTLYDPCVLCGSRFVDITQGLEIRIKDLMVS